MYAVQSRFIQHAPCPRCNSRDNMALYEGGTGFCFGCGFFQRSLSSPLANANRMVERGTSTESRSGTLDGVRSLPDDCVSYYPPVVVEWIKKYDLSPVDLINHNVVWSPKREQLIYRFFGEGENVVLWQARNFRKGTTHKGRFFTSGSPKDVIAKYSTSESADTAVIVEDCVSAIKVSYAGVDGVPCFSAAMPKEKLTRLCKLYKKIVVWLDEDKLNEARTLASQACMLGAHSKLVYTEFDPKEYPVKDIKEYIQING